MNELVFKIINTVLFLLAFLCFWLPYKCGKKYTGITTGLILIFIIGVASTHDLFSVILYLLVIIFSLIFLSYWSFIFFGLRKTGVTLTVCLSIVFTFILVQPWIDDFMFNKEDALTILNNQGFTFQENVELISNSSEGLRDFYHMFELKISKRDYLKVKNKIIESRNFIQLADSSWQVKDKTLKTYDTLNFENDYSYTREYYSRNKLKDGTYHFTFQLSKKDTVLNYIGSDE